MRGAEESSSKARAKGALRGGREKRGERNTTVASPSFFFSWPRSMAGVDYEAPHG